MSDEPKYLAWTACIAAGVVGLATLGYFLGPVKQPEKQKPQAGGRPGAGGPPPGMGAGGPPGGQLTQEDLFRMLLQQQLQQAQQQQPQQASPSQQAQAFQQQLQRQQMQQMMQQQQKQPKALAGSPSPAAKSPATPSALPAAAPQPASKEEKLHEYIMNFRRNITTRAFDEAERVLEQMGQDLGRGDEWILTCYEGVRIYLGMQQWQRCIDLSRKFLEHVLSEPLKLETSEQIFHILYSVQKAGAKVENSKVGLEESKSFLARLSELIDKSAEDQEAQEASVELYLHCANILILQKLRQLALWTELHKIAEEVKEKVTPLKPALLDKIVESQASALHQEGKTTDAIARIRAYYDLVKNLEDESKDAVIPWCLGRMAKFHFYLDQYQESLELLNELLSYHKEQASQMSAQDLLDLMSDYVELDDEENAQTIIDLIKPLPGAHICTRSQYLITTDFTITDRYEINVKVCRSPPARKEGDEDDDEDNYVRKLDNFFLEVTFENPDHTGEPFVIEQPIDHYDIDLKSPKFSVTPEKAWYVIKMVLYKDGSKEEILGKHYQLVYPGATY